MLPRSGVGRTLCKACFCEDAQQASFWLKKLVQQVVPDHEHNFTMVRLVVGTVFIKGYWLQGKILVGTKASEFIEISEKTAEAKMVTCGHGEGELWGLHTHPSELKFVTASDDGTLRMWDITAKVGVDFWMTPDFAECVMVYTFHKSVPVLALFMHSLAVLDSFQRMLNKLSTGAARSCAISPDGEMVAVGLKNGGLAVVHASSFKIWGQRRDRGEMINDIRLVNLAKGTKYLCTVL